MRSKAWWVHRCCICRAGFTRRCSGVAIRDPILNPFRRVKPALPWPEKHRATTVVHPARSLVCLLGLIALCPVVRADSGREKTKRRIVFHDDAQSLQEAPAEGTSEFLRDFIRREISRVPITTFCYLAAMPDICFHDTQVGEVIGDRLEKVPAQFKPHGPSHIRGVRGLRAEGTDILKLVVSELRPRGIEVLAAVRMNDTHHKSLDPSLVFCPQFAIDHPEYVIKQPDGRTNETALDYSYPEVRAHRLAIMQELVEEYAIDGLELNFCRWTKHFPRHQGRAKAHIMTDFMGQVRRVLDEAARKRSRGRLTLGVRVPETIRDCWMAGVDPKTWVQRGWIDYLTIATFNETDPQVRVEPFAAFTRGTACELLVAMGDMMGGIWTGPPKITDRGIAQARDGYHGMLLTAAEARAAAHNYYAYGADGISFWNVSCNMGEQGSWCGPEHRERIWGWMNAAIDRKNLLANPRRYHFVPIYKGMAKRSPHRNYAWGAEGQSPSGTRKTQVLEFPAEAVGVRKAYRFRMADGRQGEKLSGTLRFRVFHVNEEDVLSVDLNEQVIDPSMIRRSAFAGDEAGLPGMWFELSLQECPPLRGDNELGLALETKANRKATPYMEELDILVR